MPESDYEAQEFTPIKPGDLDLLPTDVLEDYIYSLYRDEWVLKGRTNMELYRLEVCGWCDESILRACENERQEIRLDVAAVWDEVCRRTQEKTNETC